MSGWMVTERFLRILATPGGERGNPLGSSHHCVAVLHFLNYVIRSNLGSGYPAPLVTFEDLLSSADGALADHGPAGETARNYSSLRIARVCATHDNTGNDTCPEFDNG